MLRTVITLKKVCFTDRNIGYYYIYLYTYLVSRLLCGVGSSSICKKIHHFQTFRSRCIICIRGLTFPNTVRARVGFGPFSCPWIRALKLPHHQPLISKSASVACSSLAHTSRTNLSVKRHMYQCCIIKHWLISGLTTCTTPVSSTSASFKTEILLTPFSNFSSGNPRLNIYHRMRSNK